MGSVGRFYCPGARKLGRSLARLALPTERYNRVASMGVVHLLTAERQEFYRQQAPFQPVFDRVREDANSHLQLGSQAR